MLEDREGYSPPESGKLEATSPDKVPISHSTSDVIRQSMQGSTPGIYSVSSDAGAGNSPGATAAQSDAAGSNPGDTTMPKAPQSPAGHMPSLASDEFGTANRAEIGPEKPEVKHFHSGGPEQIG